jgi:hypothetical protein
MAVLQPRGRVRRSDVKKKKHTHGHLTPHLLGAVGWGYTGGEEASVDGRGDIAMSLHDAANGHVEVLTVLVELGADKEAKTANGVTPLHMAAINGHVEALTVLAQQGADIAARTVC